MNHVGIGKAIAASLARLQYIVFKSDISFGEKISFRSLKAFLKELKLVDLTNYHKWTTA